VLDREDEGLFETVVTAAAPGLVDGPRSEGLFDIVLPEVVSLPAVFLTPKGVGTVLDSVVDVPIETLLELSATPLLDVKVPERLDDSAGVPLDAVAPVESLDPEAAKPVDEVAAALIGDVIAALLKDPAAKSLDVALSVLD